MAKGLDINARSIALLLDLVPPELAEQFKGKLRENYVSNRKLTYLDCELNEKDPGKWSDAIAGLYLKALYKKHPTKVLVRNLMRFARVDLIDPADIRERASLHRSVAGDLTDADRFLMLFTLKLHGKEFCSIVPADVSLQDVISCFTRDLPFDDSETTPADRAFRILASKLPSDVTHQSRATTRLINYLSSHPEVARAVWDEWGSTVGSIQVFREYMLGSELSEIKRNRYLALISKMFWKDHSQMGCGITIDGICSNEVDRLTTRLVGKAGSRSELLSIAIPWDSAVTTELSPLKATPLPALIYHEVSNQIFQIADGTEDKTPYYAIAVSLSEELNLLHSFDFEGEADRLFKMCDKSTIKTERDLWRAVYNNYVLVDSQPFNVAKNITRVASKAFGANLHGRFDYYTYLRGAFKVVVPSRVQGEFKSLREYHSGDDPRRIYWGAAGRSDKLFVRELEADNNPPVVLLVDAQSVVGPRSDEKIRHQLYEQIARAGVGQTPLQVTLVWRGITENIVIPATVRSTIAVARADEYPRSLQALETALLKIEEISHLEKRLCGETLDYSADIALGACPIKVKGAVIIPIMSKATRDAQAKMLEGLIAMGNQVCY